MLNCKTAKEQIPITAFLDSLGYKADSKRTKPGEAWYLAPWRSEKIASLKVNTDTNLYFDHGSGEGGSVIDLAMKIFNKHTVSEVLKVLVSDYSYLVTVCQSEPVKKDRAENKDWITVKKLQPLQNKALLDYLEKERKLNLDFCRQYLQEAYYTVKGRKKTYFGVAFGTDDPQSWEIHNAYFKGVVGHKTVSTFEGKNGFLAVFEGWSDYLSYLTMLDKSKLDSSVIVLNSCSMYGAVVEFIQEKKIQRAYLALDNDQGGREAVQKIWINAPCEIKDLSGCYRDFKDLNEALQQGFSIYNKE